MAERTAVAGLVERVLASRRRGRADPPSRGASADKSAAEVAALEQEIDAHVYRLYSLTKDEIKLVESSFVPRGGPTADKESTVR